MFVFKIDDGLLGLLGANKPADVSLEDWASQVMTIGLEALAHNATESTNFYARLDGCAYLETRQSRKPLPQES